MAVLANSTPAPAIPPALQLTHKAETYIARQLRPLGCPPGVDPARWRKAVAKRIERHQAAAEALIASLDLMDGDADIEENGDEHDASYPQLGPRVLGNGGEFEDSEESDADEDDGTPEPSLGSPEIPPTRLMPGGRYGWHTEQGSQAHWADGRPGDHEREVEDEHGGDISDEPHDAECDTREADGLEWGERDESENDSGQMIPGGGETTLAVSP